MSRAARLVDLLLEDRMPEPRQNKSRTPRSRADCEVVRRLLAVARSGADVRGHKVRRVKAAIREQDYENDLKLAVALQRLEELLREEAALLSDL